MKPPVQTFLLLAALLGLAAGSAFAAEPTLDEFFESFALEWTRGDPQQATRKQTFQGAEQDALDRQLTPVTDEYRQSRVALAQRGLAELRRFDRMQLTPRQRLYADTLEWQLATEIQGAAFRDFEFPFQQWNGVQLALVDFLTKDHPLRNPRDAENYLARLAQVGPSMDDACTVATARAQKGFIPPRFILTATIEQMERFLEPALRQNILVTTVVHGTTALPGLAADVRLSLKQSAERLVADSVQPAYRRAVTLLRGLLPGATDDAGLWRFKGGEAAYAHALRLQTSTDLTAEQIHELGRREVARLEREMDPLLRSLGLTDGTVVARMQQLDEQSFYPEEPDVREKILADYDRLIRDAEQRCTTMFDLRPKAAVVVRRESEFSEQNASANYNDPAKDGSRPGIFRVPLPGPRFPRVASMRSTTYHETVPGHHFQCALMQEMADLPRFVREGTVLPESTNAYGEGWALYAEQLAAESGWYNGDVRGRLGQLDDQLFRARRLIIDPGLHARRWTRQQAIDFGFEVSEVERYVVWPGQACGYLVGMLKILELREKTRSVLGAKFSLKEFHNVILRTAAVPLPILERAIDDYLRAASAPTRYDVILRGGTIYDGSGGQPFVADLALQGDRIAAVGDLARAEARQTINVAGLAVAPGFINVMSWANESLIADGQSQSDIRQGVTLEVLGEGESMGPLNEAMKAALLADQGDIKYAIEWTTLGEYLAHLEKRGVSCNVASFLGAATPRIHELGPVDRQPTPAELARMQAIVRTAMEEGALGIASALIYAPGAYARTDELIALCRAAAPYGGRYISHLRSEGNQFLESLDELIMIAREARIPAEVYHLKAAGKPNWPKMDEAIAKVERARREGLSITADMYTYPAASTGLDAMMPPWVQEGGYAAWAARLRDPTTRQRVRREMTTPSGAWENYLLLVGSADKVQLVGFKNEQLKPLTGKTLAEVSRLRGKSPEDTAIDLVLEDGSRVLCVYFLMDENNVRKQVALPWMAFCSDSASQAPEGVFLKSNPHPRAYGSFARLLAKYVRTEKVVPLEEAVRRLTLFPGENLKLKERGALRPGWFADVVVFDPANIQDHATFEKPHQYATGMMHVFVNGVPVLRDGEHTGAKPGRFVRGPGWKPK